MQEIDIEPLVCRSFMSVFRTRPFKAKSEISSALYVTIYTTSTPHSVNTKHFNKHIPTVVSSTIRSLRSIACRKQSFHLVAGSVPVESLPSVTAKGTCITWSSRIGYIIKSVHRVFFVVTPSLPMRRVL